MYYIIIRWPLWVGKTTISKALAKKLNAKYFSIDDVLSENGLDLIDKDIGCISIKNFIKANDLVIQQIDLYLKNNIPVVID